MGEQLWVQQVAGAAVPGCCIPLTTTRVDAGRGSGYQTDARIRGVHVQEHHQQRHCKEAHSADGKHAYHNCFQRASLKTWGRAFHPFVVGRNKTN